VFAIFSVQADHFKLIREIGAASTILLKNANATLPLNLHHIKLKISALESHLNSEGDENLV